MALLHVYLIKQTVMILRELISSKCFLLILISAFIISCKSDQRTSEIKESTFEVPILLDRSEKIRLGKEWDFVQNFYSEQKQELSKNSKNYEAALKLSELFIKEARVTGEHGHYYPSALKLLNHILNNHDKEDDLKYRAIITKAGVQLSLHEFQDALTTAKAGLSFKVQNAQLYGVLTDCYVELGEYAKAVETADKMVNIKPDIRSYSRISYLREIHGDVKGAQEALTLAIKSGYPGTEETAWAMLTLGDLYMEYGEIDKAEKIYSEILELRQDYPFAISAKGKVAHEKGQLEKAKQLQKEAMNIIPEVSFYVDLVKVLKEENKKDEVDSLMAEIFLMLEDDVQAGHNMNMEYANIHLEIYGDHEKALSFMKTEFDKRPKNIDVNRMLAKIYASSGNKSKAEEHLEKAKITNSKHPDLKLIAKLLS